MKLFNFLGKSTFLLIFFASITGCASKTILEVAPEDWIYEERAIHVHAAAPEDLNAISGRPHTLMVGIFQLNDPNTFQGVSATREGAVKLLNEGRVDDSIAQFDRLIIQPGEKKVIALDRAQGAMYVGLISGYFGLNTELDIHTFDIPVKEAKRGAVDIVLSGVGLIADEARAVPDDMFIRVSLGRKSTREVNVVDKEETKLF
ncbi:type VI secretion system lipoprotein TssJ [Bacterioplanoides sp.]|uniref:type VI secretion system lipoprotein TssJ n=1 Tax=Bacterioplanoides sp. TaxID=2066072 RepID=UPI003B00C857